MGTAEDRAIVWETLAQFWVDTEYDSSQLDRFAAKLAATSFTLTELDRIAYRDVCGAFAIETLAVLGTAGIAMVDWYYPEDVARRDVEKWVSRPLAFSLLNPAWLLGYALARWFLRNYWSELRERVSTARASAA